MPKLEVLSDLVCAFCVLSYSMRRTVVVVYWEDRTQQVGKDSTKWGRGVWVLSLPTMGFTASIHGCPCNKSSTTAYILYKIYPFESQQRPKNDIISSCAHKPYSSYITLPNYVRRCSSDLTVLPTSAARVASRGRCACNWHFCFDIFPLKSPFGAS